MYYRKAGQLFVPALALILAAAVSFQSVAASKDSGRNISYDEAYYAILDHYGNITEGSVVKSCIMNGVTEITDYGRYDSVSNLTDGRIPSYEDGVLRFDFTDGDVPSHFYYEGKTSEIYENLPWDISVRYRLNGVLTEAEDLTGRTGTVDILIDIIPDRNASEYARYNYTLETAALFNQDKITSLEAEGAQIQLLGNIRMVLFAALPGEEQHLVIRVGTESFEFDGLTFMMLPATLGQLSELSKLAENKEKIEEDYDRLSDRVDRILDRFDDMNADILRTADDLERLDRDARRLSQATEPLAGDLGEARQMIESSLDVLDPTLADIVSLKIELRRLGDIIDFLQSDLGDADDKLDMLSSVRDSLSDTADSLEDIRRFRIENEDIEASAETACELHQLYLYYISTGLLDPSVTSYETFMTGILMQKGYGADEARAAASKLAKLYRLSSSGDTDDLDSLSLLGGSIDDITGQISGLLDSTMGAPEELLLDLRSVIGNVRGYRQLIKDLNSLGTVTQQAVVVKGQMILEEIEALDSLIDNYRPQGRQLADDLIRSASAVAESADDTGILLGDLAKTLRRAADDDGSSEIREIKDDLSRIIEDTWSDYTGDINNLLLMDADAPCESLTDRRNPSPSSIQIIMRTAEIKPETGAVTRKTADSTQEEDTGKNSLAGRISVMFSDIASHVRGLFARGNADD